ncbi:5-deoxy-glucuronate isomerase [Thermoflexus sp.]|uniref:5-deoxy-glucuronate isomerase n=1 Tax=Thermoflexus sp. TaxID=1969742 RepID=UPI0025D14D49|nr:5-deoxy-glucuronate isomerase [Thermoflexus sp.]MCS6962528.1 5-deoxy-glucuronate isomerase [Thermoflexus sp.]MCX7690315.1 5-deoxy-glucuronate isomerase [Thermoflexus sp.]MDW8183633.1 5-deoxy-glucuronate isomerase [Anaerolineae bacterium]
MGSLRLRAPLGWGYVRIAEPGSTPLRYLRFGVLRLQAGMAQVLTFPGEESLLVLLRGQAKLRWSDRTAQVARRDVFTDPATALYVPPGDSVFLEAEEETEWAVAHAAGEVVFPVRLILPADLRPREAGGPGFRRRIVELLGPEDAAFHLLVGETFTPAGNWSSYPPHKHDEERPGQEAALEEIYFYKIHPPQGFALQWIYTSDGDLDEAIAVRSDEAVLIPRGYHPVAAPPGYDVYYLWAMAGPRRDLRVASDPAHAWLLERHHLSSPR